MAQQSAIRVDSIVDLSGTGPVNLPNSAIIPDGGVLKANGNVNVGVATVGVLTTTSLNASTVTASSFVGDGSQLTGLPIINNGKAIALTLIS